MADDDEFIHPDAEMDIMFSPEVQDQMAKDPKLAEMIRSVNASFRQAFDGVKRGMYPNLDEAMKSITGGTVRRLGEIDPETNEFIDTKDKT